MLLSCRAPVSAYLKILPTEKRLLTVKKTYFTTVVIDFRVSSFSLHPTFKVRSTVFVNYSFRFFTPRRVHFSQQTLSAPFSSLDTCKSTWILEPVKFFRSWIFMKNSVPPSPSSNTFKREVILQP